MQLRPFLSPVKQVQSWDKEWVRVTEGGLMALATNGEGRFAARREVLPDVRKQCIPRTRGARHKRRTYFQAVAARGNRLIRLVN
jgi:hypothetical protein